MSLVYIGWSIFELVNTSKVGFNLMSKDIYIIKIVYSIIIFIFSVSYKRIYTKFGYKKKGHDFIVAAEMIFVLVGFLFFIIGVITDNISNYSETYENCCINQISSNKVYYYYLFIY